MVVCGYATKVHMMCNTILQLTGSLHVIQAYREMMRVLVRQLIVADGDLTNQQLTNLAGDTCPKMCSQKGNCILG